MDMKTVEMENLNIKRVEEAGSRIKKSKAILRSLLSKTECEDGLSYHYP